jgi:hypothetical protein
VFEKLVNPNEDLQRLVQKGYAVGFDDGYMLIRDIPYLDDKLDLQWGAFVTKLVAVADGGVRQEDHQVFFAGSPPHNLDGKPIPNLGDRAATLALDKLNDDIVVERQFSVRPKPIQDYADFFDKVECYVALVSGPAISKYDANPLTFKARHEIPDSVFLRHDLLSSRAEIGDLSALLKNDIVAVIGLGGTGSYVLDLLAKTPVREIRGFDADVFHLHTVFRSPGMIDMNDLGKPKADIYGSRYKEFRIGIATENVRIDASSEKHLQGVTFAFVCVDKGSARKEIIDLLFSMGIPFIDVGMGLGRKGDGPIGGMVRSTYFPVAEGHAILSKGLVPLTDNPDDIYRTNVQLAELNALNACLAVIRFKQIRGFYEAEKGDHQSVFEIKDMLVTPWRLE